MLYTINGKYELESENRLELLEKIIDKEKISIEEKKEEGKFVFLSQRDKRWASQKIGQSPLSVGDYGCTITTLSMFSSWYGKFHNPEWMAKHLSFTGSGLLIWNSITESELPMRFVYRYYTRDDNKIQEILKSKDGVCLLQVNNGKHWVALIGYSKLHGYKVADPYYGDSIWLKSRYQNITGFTELVRK